MEEGGPNPSTLDPNQRLERFTTVRLLEFMTLAFSLKSSQVLRMGQRLDARDCVTCQSYMLNAFVIALDSLPPSTQRILKLNCWERMIRESILLAERLFLKKNAATYLDSTAFEALIGYMYMEDEIRCFEMLNWIRREQRDLDEAQGVQVVSAGNPAEPESLLELLQPRSDCDVDRIAPAQLAYIGDSVYELLARNRYVWPHRRTADLHQKVVGVSRAETQSEIYKALTRDETSGVELTTAEKSILTRGRNAAGGSGGRNKNMNRARKEEEGGGAAMHQEAAALEALLGHAFIEDPARCLELLRWLSLQLDAVDFA